MINKDSLMRRRLCDKLNCDQLSFVLFGYSAMCVLLCRKKIKLLMQCRRRLLKRNAGLEAVIEDMRQKNVLSSESITILRNSAGGIEDLIKRRSQKLSGGLTPTTYSPELRSFALTLHFYSPHAYRYVRRMFDTCLPHPRTLEKWF